MDHDSVILRSRSVHRVRLGDPDQPHVDRRLGAAAAAPGTAQDVSPCDTVWRVPGHLGRVAAAADNVQVVHGQSYHSANVAPPKLCVFICASLLDAQGIYVYINTHGKR